MKKATLNSLVLLLFLVSLLVVTQVFEVAVAEAPSSSQTWNRIYFGGIQDAAWSVIQTVDGGYALACNTWSLSTGGMDVLLIKTDAAGNIQWNVAYGGPSMDGANSLIATSDDGYAIAGYTGSLIEGSTGIFNAVNVDCWLIKTDPSGNMQWNKTFGGTGSEYGRAVIETSDGGYAIAGHAFSSVEEGRENFWLIKTDSSGNMQWNQTYGGLQGDLAYSIVATPDGGYALTGYTSSFGSPNNCLLVKTDALGNMQWNKTYPAQGAYGSHALLMTSDGGYVLTGNAYFQNFATSDLWLAKTDVLGNLEWQQTYNAKGLEHAYALVSTSDGGYAIAGFTTPGSAEETDGLLVKTDVLGNMQWSKTYGGEYADATYTMVQTADGGYALAGSWMYLANSVLGGNVWLIKTDTEGNTPNLFSPTPTPKPTPTTTPSTSPTATPTSAPTSTPKPIPTPNLSSKTIQPLNQTSTPTPTLFPTSSPSPTQAPTAEATPKPPAALPIQQHRVPTSAEPTNNTPIAWVPIAVVAFAVAAIGIVAYNLRKLKKEA